MNNKYEKTSHDDRRTATVSWDENFRVATQLAMLSMTTLMVC